MLGDEHGQGAQGHADGDGEDRGQAGDGRLHHDAPAAEGAQHHEREDGRHGCTTGRVGRQREGVSGGKFAGDGDRRRPDAAGENDARGRGPGPAGHGSNR